MAANARSAVPGLIAAWRLRPGEAPEPLLGLEAMGVLASGEDGLWLHADLADPRARDLFVRLPIPAAARRALLEPDEAPHLEAADGAIYGGSPISSRPERAPASRRRRCCTSCLSAAILPATMITGVFGMNVGAVPGVDKEWGFVMAMGLVVGSTVVILAALRFWKLL